MTWAKAFSGIAAPISARPPTTPPGCGEVRWTAGATLRLAIPERAFHTETDSGATVTSTRLSRPDRRVVSAPYSGLKPILGL